MSSKNLIDKTIDFKHNRNVDRGVFRGGHGAMPPPLTASIVKLA